MILQREQESFFQLVDKYCNESNDFQPVWIRVMYRREKKLVLIRATGRTDKILTLTKILHVTWGEALRRLFQVLFAGNYYYLSCCDFATQMT